MKKTAATILALLMLAGALAGCNKAAAPARDGKISVVCTIFPQYDWVRQILGDKAGGYDLTLLQSSKIDLHNYQPSVDDIVKISTCDLFIYVGGESDAWVDDALAEAKNEDMIVINLLDELGDAAKEEELLEGMQEEEEENAEEEEGEIEYDEHIWLSLGNAQILSRVITGALIALDEENSEQFQKNHAAYAEKLSALDFEYQKAVGAAAVKTLLFGDRFPFRYLLDDYGLTPYAAFSGCSAETEASFDTLVFLVEKVDELGLKTIMVTESADQSIANKIKDSTKDKNQQILVLDAMQSVTSGDVDSGATYLSIMESNLNVLKEALS